MNKYIQNIQKGQEGVFTSFELMKKYPDMDALTALLYGQIKYWATNKEGYCWASNEKFAKLLRVSKTTIFRMLTYLIDKGLITRVLEIDNTRKLFIVEMNEPTHIEQPSIQNEYPSIQNEYPSIQNEYPSIQNEYPSIQIEYPSIQIEYPSIQNEMIESIIKLESKIENKLESNNINYNMQNLDLVEDMEGGDNITSTNPEGGEDVTIYIKPVIEESLEEKMKKYKTKISKKEEFDISQRNIEDKFSKEELNAFDYE